MQKNLFEDYLAPQCEVAEVNVEQGFALTQNGVPVPDGMNWDPVL